MEKTTTVGVIGLGYVGLPLAVEIGKKYRCIGFDINRKRIEELKNGLDKTREITSDELSSSKLLVLTSEESDLDKVNFFIITVPTPVDEYKKPDLRPIHSASKTVGKHLQKNDIVVYESTVYPGCTEEECVPILEKESGLKFNQDFFVGYSPERINPGDQNRRLTNIKKVTSGSTPKVATIIDNFYAGIIPAGTHKASSIKVAEASKVIENAQRDINIAFVNELSLIFDKMGLDTLEVLEASQTKWNFLPFKPGLVGGHCIGVDPYYLTYKAESLGYHPEVILSGRRINDNIGKIIAHQVIQLMLKKQINPLNAKVLIMGITFKENCPDIRNSRVIDIIQELLLSNIKVVVYDPEAIAEEVQHEYNIQLINPSKNEFDACIIAVSHDVFRSEDISSYLKPNHVIYDVKGVLPKTQSDKRL